MTGIVIAMDGPSGVGKSTIAKRVAVGYELAYLDTGAMYRAATIYLIERGIELSDGATVASAVANMPLEMGLNPADPQVRLAGQALGSRLYSREISQQVSAVATNLAVRALLKKWQRELIATERIHGFSHGRGVVAEGRDITTIVAPEADVRILLTASEQARLSRRARQRHGGDDSAMIEATRDEVIRRDADDSTVSNFTTAADGVITLDSSNLTLEQTYAAVCDIVATAKSARTQQ